MDTPMAPTVTDLAALTAAIPGLRGDLRSDHAGETGAVMIYRGILAGARDAAVRRFAAAHLATEQRHLDLLAALLPAAERSILLPLWRIAGWLTGFLPACAGPHAVYATIDAVETFVDRHYEEQIVRLPAGALRSLLATCQADEVHHRDEARALAAARPGAMLRGWVWLVGFGSRAAVAAARRM
jgi:ubiquinone biosynthesis monooxygenase Coq7